jgi:phosphatidylglycerophosphate synthase
VSELRSDLTEGEQWTREQLGRLLAARFGPRAVGGFLVASQRRASGVRAERPELGRQSRRWLAAGAAAYLPAVARGVPARSALGWWAATALMLDWHLGMLETPEGEPRPLGPADACTLARAWLVPVVAARPSPAVCALGALSDVADGRLARTAGKPTRAGRDLEGLVDFCFAVAALHGLVRDGRLGRHVVAAELARTSAGFAYALYAYFGRAERPDDDLLHHARATTGVRVAGLVAAAAGRRRLGDALVAGGSAWSLAELSRAARSRASSRGPAVSP